MTNAVFNPQNRAASELPVIYGFPNGTFGEDLIGQLIAEDGTPLGSHVCSSEGYMLRDLGIAEGARPDRHEHFKAHYPNGYRMEFVGGREVEKHAGLLRAIEANKIAQAVAAE